MSVKACLRCSVFKAKDDDIQHHLSVTQIISRLPGYHSSAGGSESASLRHQLTKFEAGELAEGTQSG